LLQPEKDLDDKMRDLPRDPEQILAKRDDEKWQMQEDMAELEKFSQL
jgi:hypothetical protein